MFQQISPYAHLVSGGKATVARMFVNMANGQRGLVCQYDVVCFDEVSGVSFDQEDGVNIMKGYMESGEFSRGRESIRADGSIVLLGNFDVDAQHQQRVGHLFGPLPPEMRNDTAVMDRIHAYLPGWDIPKVSRDLFTDHFGLVSDVLAEAFTRLRDGSRTGVLMGRVHFGGALSGRDQNAVTKTVSGLLKLIQPDGNATVSDEELEWALRLALEVRRRKGAATTHRHCGVPQHTVLLQHGIRRSGEVRRHAGVAIGGQHRPRSVISRTSLGNQPREPGRGGGLYRIEVNEGPGSGVRILNQAPPAPFRESVRIAEQNLYARTAELVG